MKNQDHIEISEGRPPLFRLLMAALAFSLTVFFLIIFFTGYNVFLPKVAHSKFDANTLYVAIILAGLGVLFGKNNSVLIDRKLGRIKNQWQLGRVGFGQWHRLPEIDYISVFKARKTYSVNFDANAPVRYEVNLWLKKGGRKRIYFSYDAPTALLMGKEIARFLNVDLWDATNPHNQKKVIIEEP